MLKEKACTILFHHCRERQFTIHILGDYIICQNRGDIDFDICLEPIIFSDYSLVAQDSSGQIFTIIGPYQFPRNNQYNQENVICGKGFVLQDLGVHDEYTNYNYKKPSNSDIKEYFIVQ